jgi:hypothetical protein
LALAEEQDQIEAWGEARTAPEDVLDGQCGDCAVANPCAALAVVVASRCRRDSAAAMGIFASASFSSGAGEQQWQGLVLNAALHIHEEWPGNDGGSQVL